jgi:hypothetical protein
MQLSILGGVFPPFTDKRPIICTFTFSAQRNVIQHCGTPLSYYRSFYSGKYYTWIMQYE